MFRDELQRGKRVAFPVDKSPAAGSIFGQNA
jgi:hypothetical protein